MLCSGFKEGFYSFQEKMRTSWLGVNRLGAWPAGRMDGMSDRVHGFLRHTFTQVGWTGTCLGEMIPNMLQILANRYKTGICMVQQPCGEQVQKQAIFREP